jgi:hypothetical protein
MGWFAPLLVVIAIIGVIIRVLMSIIESRAHAQVVANVKNWKPPIAGSSFLFVVPYRHAMRL